LAVSFSFLPSLKGEFPSKEASPFQKENLEKKQNSEENG